MNDQTNLEQTIKEMKEMTDKESDNNGKKLPVRDLPLHASSTSTTTTPASSASSSPQTTPRNRTSDDSDPRKGLGP